MDERVDCEKNGFDILRYVAAVSVMLLHYSGYSMIFSDQAMDVMNVFRRSALLFPGVVILFTMSGFLVSASFERAKTRKEFFRRRFRRIYPELWICTLVNLIVVSVLVPERLDRSMIVWLATQIFGIANTPACLKTFATGSINGVLWTVFTEVQLYFVLGIAYPFLQKRKNGFWTVLLTALAVLNLVCGMLAQEAGGIAAKLIERSMLPYALWFFIGVFCYLRRQRMLPLLKKAFVPLLVLYFLSGSLIGELPGYYTNIVTSVFLPFIVIGGGYFLPEIRLKADLSYGMFLYHWIILNIIIWFDLMNRLVWYRTLILFAAATLIAAEASRRLNRLCSRLYTKMSELQKNEKIF